MMAPSNNGLPVSEGVIAEISIASLLELTDRYEAKDADVSRGRSLGGLAAVDDPSSLSICVCHVVVAVDRDQTMAVQEGEIRGL